MRSPEFSIGINTTSYVEGHKVTVVSKVSGQPRGFSSKTTAGHEALHVAAAVKNGTSVESASIIPGPGYRGITKLSRPDAYAAAASFAFGTNGVGEVGYGGDKHAVWSMGHNLDSAASGARSLLAGEDDLIGEIAGMLEERKTIGGKDIQEAQDNVESRRKGEIIVSITNPDGETKTETKAIGRARVVFLSSEHIRPPEEKVIVQFPKPRETASSGALI